MTRSVSTFIARLLVLLLAGFSYSVFASYYELNLDQAIDNGTGLFINLGTFEIEATSGASTTETITFNSQMDSFDNCSANMQTGSVFSVSNNNCSSIQSFTSCSLDVIYSPVTGGETDQLSLLCEVYGDQVDIQLGLTGKLIGSTVTASKDSGISSLSSTSQTVTSGGSVQFTVTAKNGYTIDPTPNGTCATGSFNGSTYTLTNVTQSCTIEFTSTPIDYTLSFDLNGGNGTANAITAAYGSAVTKPADPQKAHHTFSGWNPAFPNTMPASNQTYTAQWQINQYTLTFDSAGGSSINAITGSYDSLLPSVSVPTKAGYSFVGWTPALPAKIPGGDSVYTATWTPVQYTLTFDTDGGSDINPIVGDFGTAITAPTDPTKEGHTFTGWSPSIPGTMPADDQTYVASWQVNQYTLSFETDGAGSINAMTEDFGTVLTEPGEPVKEGYFFEGWLPAFPATMPAESVLLTAQWREKAIYEVTASVIGEGEVTPTTQQIIEQTEASFSLTVDDPQSIVMIGGTCAAILSGNEIRTASVTQPCSVIVNIYPPSEAVMPTGPLSANQDRVIGFTGGAGEKTLANATLLRAGVERNLTTDEMANLITEQGNQQYRFIANKTGRYSLYFRDRISNEETQVVLEVLPYIAFSSTRVPANSYVPASYSLLLTDEPIDFPLSVQIETVQYDDLGNATGSSTLDINWTSSFGTLMPFNNVSVTENTLHRLVASSVQGAIVGSLSEIELDITDEELPARMHASVSQNAKPARVVTQDGGDVTFLMTSPEGAIASHTWTSSSLSISSNSTSVVFDPISAPLGSHKVVAELTTADGRIAKAELNIEIIAACSASDCNTSSGIPPEYNKYSDLTAKLPICPDNATQTQTEFCNVGVETEGYIQTSEQFNLSLGSWSGEQSWQDEQFGTALSDNLGLDDDFTRLGPTVNFEVSELDSAGQSVPIVIALGSTTVPENAVWRKFVNGQWQNFITDERNSLDSAMLTDGGVCPDALSDDWRQGLVAGTQCVRLTIEDGGANDNDGLVNARIEDPGVLAISNDELKSEESTRSGGALFYALFMLMGIAGWRRSLR